MAKEVIEEMVVDPPRKLSRFRGAMGHISLLVALMIYTAIGGLVFNELEFPIEISKLQALSSSVKVQRNLFLNVVTNASTDPTEIQEALLEYELIVQDAVKGGVSIPNADFNARWNLVQAIFFASTVITTIGYGDIVPVTFGGRMFCIFFALIGIPLTLTVIADLGCLFATGVSVLAAKIRKHISFIQPLKNCIQINAAGRRSLSALAAIIFLFFYLSAGAAFFTLWEEDWSFFEGFYFCFVTMTTIGFGDLVPQKPIYMLWCTLYILVGLALTSTIIELVRRQYAQSWQRLQALSGPMADALRRLGEGRGNIDVKALQKILTVISVPRKNEGGLSGAKQQKEWEDAMAALLKEFKTPAVDKPKRVLQIVIYESSV